MPDNEKTEPIAKGAYRLFLSNITATIILAVSSIVIGRLLGPNNFGLYTLALVIPGYAYTIMQLGIPTAATRFSAMYSSSGDKERSASFAYNMLLFEFIVSLLLIAALIPFSGIFARYVFHRPILQSAIAIALLALFGQSGFYTGLSALQGVGRMDRFALLQILQAMARLFMQVLLLLLGFGVLGAISGHVVGFFISGMIGLMFIKSIYGRVRPRNFISDVNTALRYAMPLYLASLVSGIVPPLQNTLLASFVSNSEIGGFGAASNISVIISLFVFPIQTVLFPAFSAYKDKAKLLDFYRLTAKYTAVFIVPVASITVIALSSPITAAVYGRVYQFAGPYLALLVLPSLLAGFGSLSQTNLLNGIGETRKSSIAGISGAIVTLASLPILIYLYGVYGAIIGSIAGQLVSFAIAWRMISNTLSGNIRVSDAYRIYIASFLSAALVYPVTFVHTYPVITVLAVGLLFLAILIPFLALTKALTRDDVAFLDSQFSRLGFIHTLLKILIRYYNIFAR
ncbi:MAG: oligosaccharide flippase family protein [Conexivisphaerales archaeon]